MLLGLAVDLVKSIGGAGSDELDLSPVRLLSEAQKRPIGSAHKEPYMSIWRENNVSWQSVESIMIAHAAGGFMLFMMQIHKI
ncbi:hypothetical protein ACFX15_032393 [Malus domestica]